MRLWRDPRDRRYGERLAGSYLASLLLHALFALLVFSVVANTSEEGASESRIGGSIVTVEQRAPVVAQAPVKTQAAPLPHAPRIAPVQHAHAAQPAHQPQPPAHHELAKFAPTAPPNPTPLPQATTQPNVQPTQAVFEPQPQNELPAVPSSAPTAAAVAVSVTIPPTAAPMPVPTAVATVRPSTRPVATAAPTTKPQTPAPATPSPVPSAVAVAPKASAAPTLSPIPAPSVSTAPAARPGVPSPSPTRAAAAAQTKGTAPSPGPKGLVSPGPRAGSAGAPKAAPERPVAVSPTATPVPSARRNGPKPTGAPNDINSKLRAMLPHGPVNPTEGSYHPSITLNGTMEPTPPPDVVATTKFIYETPNGDERIKMWVTNVRHVGMITMCEGWMLRYPAAGGVGAQRQIGTATNPISGGIQVSTTVGAKHVGTLAPIVEANASAVCSERNLVPYAPSAVPSP